MKKIYTITTQYANNQGALLQCYALQQFLLKQGNIECKVIDYLPENFNLSWAIFPKQDSLKGKLKNIYTAFHFKYIINKRKKNKSMYQFINNYIIKTEEPYNREKILKNPPQADYYICGSDQIWNMKLFQDETYYLDFVDNVKNAKRISYAASLSDAWSEQFGFNVSPLLNKFSNISIREKGNIQQIQKYAIGKQIEWVCDPVFLLSIDEWNQIARVPQEKEPYILCYFLNIEQNSVKFVNKVRKMTGLKVINLVMSSREKFKSEELVRIYNPQDFIGYIKNATFIITNSFHCSAFSSIYHKNFKFMPKSWANERIVSLEELYGYKVIMTDEMIENFKQEDMIIDYSKEDNMNKFIQHSKNYLLSAIDE